ncbi:MAG: hypothetical protein H6704_28425 [Myxococcales bacterium]|nr:hypothetical protein [Myxococcales bacterium]
MGPAKARAATRRGWRPWAGGTPALAARPGPGPGAGGAPGAGGLPANGRPLGAACTADAECADGFCITGLPEGYCSARCEDAECPGGNRCWNLGDFSACLLDCTADAECRGADGYVCDGDATCYPGQPGGGGGADVPVGGPCESNQDCGDGGGCVPEQGADGPTGFTGGYCILTECGPQNPCPQGSDCFQLQDGGSACLAVCDGREDCRAGYACDEPGVCLPGCTEGSCPAGQICGEDGQCAEPPCTPDSCAAGTVCAPSGRCQIDLGAPPAGPIPQCDSPTWRCEGGEANCGQIVFFSPVMGPGYWNYPLNGETDANQYRSFARRDLMMLIKYATAEVACLSANWNFGNQGEPLGLGDMSEQNGAIPGTSVGSPGHPQGTHTNGHDMDIGYYQVGTGNNILRPICDHVSGGQDQYHCVAEPHLLDVWRTALFLGKLHASPQLRIIGVDGQVGPLVMSAMDQLCDAGWLSGNPCDNRRAVTFEVQNENRGWYQFHHHHLHVSLSGQARKRGDAAPTWVPPERACLRPDCAPAVHDHIEHMTQDVRVPAKRLPGAIRLAR